MKLKTVRDLHPKHKRVLLSVDYNVPVSSGIVGDPLRIAASFETIRYLLDRDCSIVLISHLGRPKGKVVPELSLGPVAKKASEMLGRHVMFVPDCVGEQAKAATKALGPKEIILLENTRFHAGEDANDPEFAKELAELGDVYVDDAFANLHRAHASIVGVPQYLPSAAGLLVEKEVMTITGALQHPVRPLLAVVGGAKVSTKIDVLRNLIKHVNRLVVGGAMANTFLAAQGLGIGKSMHEPELFEEARQIIKESEAAGVELILPRDVIVAESPEHGPGHLVDVDAVGKKDVIVDVGPKTVAAALHPLDFHGSVIWNGPLGITEIRDFAHGTRLLAEAIIESGAESIVGGGETAAFVDQEGLHDKFTWISTGGGASLELMAGNELPGLKALEGQLV